MLTCPLITNLTMNYEDALKLMLAAQLALLVWMHFGVHESIRWLLSEGQITRAQIELQRACQTNRIQNGGKLAHKIAQIQQEQMRRASDIIDDKLNEFKLEPTSIIVSSSQADDPNSEPAGDQKGVSLQHKQLSIMSEAIKRSRAPAIGSNKQELESAAIGAPQEDALSIAASCNSHTLSVLSPTLTRRSFSLKNTPTGDGFVDLDWEQRRQDERTTELVLSRIAPENRNSLASRSLVELAIRYSRRVEQEQDGFCFVTKLFHPKLYKITITLSIISVMSEFAYYGLVQASTLVGSDADLNYVATGLSEWLADSTYILLMWAFSRRVSLIGPSCVCALCCLGMAATFQLLPYSHNLNTLAVPAMNYETTVGELRELINFWLMTIGKLSISVIILAFFTVTLEVFPNNLRNTALGCMSLAGRAGCIVAPILFDDTSEDKLVLRCSLIGVASVGLLGSLMAAKYQPETKNCELRDHINDV